MYEQLLQKKAKLAVIGLGYVGLPIALEFARKLSVIGFDINAARVDLMRNGIDPSGELEAQDFEGCDITFTDVYPGCTEEDCIPVMEKLSGLSFPQDFKVGYS